LPKIARNKDKPEKNKNIMSNKSKSRRQKREAQQERQARRVVIGLFIALVVLGIIMLAVMSLV
jgi:cell division septal protein FtsQ